MPLPLASHLFFRFLQIRIAQGRISSPFHPTPSPLLIFLARPRIYLQD